VIIGFSHCSHPNFKIFEWTRDTTSRKFHSWLVVGHSQNSGAINC
jgi:hypothetical protein